MAAPLTACDDTPADSLAAWRGPAPGVTEPRLRALSWALLAPSPHNAQAWLAQLIGRDEIEVRADRSRLLPVVDPAARQTLIGMGAFLELVALAGSAMGQRVDVGLSAEGATDLPVAALRLTAASELAVDPLFAALPRRRSTKLAYDLEKPIRPEHAEQLARAAGAAGVTVGFAVEPALVAALRRVALSAFEVEYGLPAALDESVRWMRLGGAEVAASPDGIALTGTPVWFLRELGLLSRADLARPGSLAWRVGLLRWRNLIAGTASFGWLATAGDGTADRILAGRAYQRLDLAAAVAGVAIHPLSQALGDYSETMAARGELESLLGVHAPARVQMLFRLGYAGPQTASPRRLLTAIVAI